jgi:hypothetical protein
LEAPPLADEDVDEVVWKRTCWRLGTRRAALPWDSDSLVADLVEIMLEMRNVVKELDLE